MSNKKNKRSLQARTPTKLGTNTKQKQT